MEIVIKIDDERYKDIQRIAEVQLDRSRFQTAEQVIANGIPLPKGHGRLIDEEQIPGDGGWDFSDRLMLTPTIIEADNEQNLRMKQESVLDKVEEEIKDTLYVDSLIFTELIDFKNGKIDADDVIEEFNRVTRMEVLRIIDKYKLESEGKE